MESSTGFSINHELRKGETQDEQKRSFRNNWLICGYITLL